jgi:excisionase family DNA binding protein
MDIDTLPLLLPIPAAARQLGIGRSTVYELIAAGRLRVVHIGRSARIPREALGDFVRSITPDEEEGGCP